MSYDDMNGWVLGGVLSYHFNLFICCVVNLFVVLRRIDCPKSPNAVLACL